MVAVNPRRQVATVAKIATDRGGNAFQQSTTNQPMFNQHHKQCTTHNKTHNVRRLLNLPRGPSADRFIAAALNAQCTTNDLHNVSMMQRQSQPDTWLPADRFIDQCCNAQPCLFNTMQNAIARHWLALSLITGSGSSRAPLRSVALPLLGTPAGLAQAAQEPQPE